MSSYVHNDINETPNDLKHELLDLQDPDPELPWEQLKMSIIGSCGAGKTSLLQMIS